MKLLGFEITRTKALPRALSPVPYGSSGGWITVYHDTPPGAFQANTTYPMETVLAYHAVFACVTLISADIGKLRLMLVAQDRDGIWEETTSPAFSPVLRKPNRFQTHIQFKEWWTTSKLINGNAYVLKGRDQRGIVTDLYLLDPCRVTVLVSPDGSVFYDLAADNLAGLENAKVRVPASEIIHDRFNCLFHPLVGVSPISACGMAADQGLRIQRNQSTFFANNSTPGGILIAPTEITDQNAREIKDYWEANYTGSKSGRIAVLSGGMKFEPMRMNAVDSQLVEQLGMTAEIVCSVFHVPKHKIGIGPPPAYNNIEALNQDYYSQCLQTLIEAMELCLDEGLGLDTPKDGVQMGTQLDLDGLLRMDTATQMNTLKVGVDGGIFAPNEARRKVNLGPLKGGDTVYLQQQQYSIEALAERDADKPFSKPAAAAQGSPAASAAPPEPDAEAEMRAFMDEITKGLADATV